jgi:ankyrin repeat protein
MSQPRSLPEHPNLDHLRRQAKALRDAARAGEPEALARITRYLPLRPDGTVVLSTAQLVIAREYGFESWPQLNSEVTARAMPLPKRVAAFLTAAVEGRDQQAVRLLSSGARIAGADIRTAAVLGDAARVRELIQADPAAALTPDADRGWPPLLYVCHSRWHRIDPARAAGMTEIARMLLDAGASPDTGNGRPARTGRYRSALYGAAGIANNPAITELLLDRGANPNDDESLYHSVYHRDHACLRLLLAHGARVNGANALAAATGAGDVEAVRLLVEAGGDPGRPPTAPAPAGHLADRSINPLVAAAVNDTAAVVEVLLAAGADPDAATRTGISPVRQAVRRGALDVAEVLLRHGAHDDTTAIDHFLGTCVRADRAAATNQAELVGQLSEVDLATFVQAAGRSGVDAVELMLDLGFPVDARDEDGQTALHEAAYAGQVDVARLLLDRGAELDARDGQWQCTPLCFALVGSGERPAFSGESVATVRLLLDAGAERTGVWIDGKPPSEDVAAVLHGYGITGPDEPDETEPVVDPQVQADVANRLRAAMDADDLDQFAALLHPQARWGSCANRDQVLDWFRALHAAGVRLTVRDTVLQPDAILLELAVHNPEGASWPASPESVCQAFRVADGAIAEIRGYASVADALAAS